MPQIGNADTMSKTSKDRTFKEARPFDISFYGFKANVRIIKDRESTQVILKSNDTWTTKFIPEGDNQQPKIEYIVALKEGATKYNRSTFDVKFISRGY